MSGALGGQKRSSDPLELELKMVVEPLCRCWESNLSPMEKQLVLLTTKAPSRPSFFFFKLIHKTIKTIQINRVLKRVSYQIHKVSRGNSRTGLLRTHICRPALPVTESVPEHPSFPPPTDITQDSSPLR